MSFKINSYSISSTFMHTDMPLLDEEFDSFEDVNPWSSFNKKLF